MENICTSPYQQQLQKSTLMNSYGKSQGLKESWTKFRVLILPQRKSLNALFCCCLRTQLCSTLFDPMDCSRPGSSVTGISQTRILGWVAISSPRDLPNPGTEPASPALAGEFFTTKPPGKPLIHLFFSFRVKKWENHPSIFLI